MKRIVLAVAILAALLLPALEAGAFRRPYAATTPTFGFEEAAAWARTFDAAYDAMPVDLKVGITSQTEMSNLIREIVPFFEYEGITFPGLLVYPKVAKFEYYQGGLEHNHVLGRTSILTGDISLNARTANPASSWYGRNDSLGTLVHELAHAQGVVVGDRLDAEVSAQLVTLEVMAAMSNRGDTRMFVALLEELREMALSAAKYISMSTGRDGEYQALLDEVEPDAFAQARRAKSDRFWASDPEQLEHILRAYNFEPMQEVYLALVTDRTIEGVDLPINHMCKFAPIYSYSTDTDEEVEPCVGKPLVLDDIAYLFDHYEEMAASLAGGQR